MGGFKPPNSFLYKLPIDKSSYKVYNWRAAGEWAARKFHYTIVPAICQAFSRKNFNKFIFPILCILPIAIWGCLCYNT